LKFVGDDAKTVKGRSVVIHNNAVRVACGNILPKGDGQNSRSSSSGDQVDQNGSDGVAVPEQQQQQQPQKQSSGNSNSAMGWNAAAISAMGLLGGLLMV
ncbi:hypothetical protein BGZ65_008221, partial [Modicella reniformis]